MPTLSSSIIKHGVASVRDVEEALSRQSLHGGDFVTNLLEVAPIDERRLCQVLAESSGLEPAPPGVLPMPAPEVLGRAPRELVERYRFYPLNIANEYLVVAIGYALPIRVEQTIVAELGLGLKQCIAPLIRVDEALSRDYGLDLDLRSRRLLERLGEPAPRASAPPPPTTANTASSPARNSSLPLARSVAPAARTTGAPPQVRSAPPKPSSLPAAPRLPVDSVPVSARDSWPELEVAQSALGSDAPRLKPESVRRPRRLGPYTAAMAEADLRAADNRDEVLRAFFDFASQYFEYTALFAVQGDLAEGREAAGPGTSASRVLGIGVPLDLPSALSKARDSNSYELLRLGSAGLDGQLARDLNRKPGPLVLLLPLRVRGRTVLILYGDHGNSDVELGAVGDVLSFAPLTAASIERLIMRRKLEQRGSVSPPSVRAPASVRPPPVQARVLSTAEARTRALMSTITPETPVVDELMPTPVWPGTVVSRAPSDVEPRSDRAFLDESRDGFAQAATQPRFPLTNRPQADISGHAEAHPARVPPASRNDLAEQRLPSVIVDHSELVPELVERLVLGDQRALDRLVDVGAPAIPALIARFPGPISQESRRPGAEGQLKASERGLIMKALVRIGAEAAPFLIARSADSSSAVRVWATRVLGELPSPEAARSVVRRFQDPDNEVRRGAIAAANLLQHAPEAGWALWSELDTLIRDNSLPEENRLMVLEALANLRDPRAVSGLLLLLENASRSIVHSAKWALYEITRQDFGSDIAAWQAWWSNNSSRHRIEWLIDALMHESQEVRRTAAEELKTLTKEYFGYYDDLPKRERLRAQERYREWWESTGKQRFRTGA